ncbi:hypothetical protein BZL30_8393 [Mycobacterium kansasii]|uniref:Uncharacterized protein n=1 Tax=Mycobacterium kansasii TaxID=1768 RepID=A0A1V3WIE4_MYCKA|nr:hypothetical protein BZL30_8393 [Mycobacterium kansasii]
MTTNDIPHLHSEASATDESYRDFGSLIAHSPSNFVTQIFLRGCKFQSAVEYPPRQPTAPP